MKVVSAEEMRKIDRIAIQERGIPSRELMERAGRAVADMVVREFDPEYVAVITGKGNNAGDGFVVARLLSDNDIDVHVFMLAPSEDIKGDALANFEKLPPECKISLVTNIGDLEEDLVDSDCIVDAILGTGVQGPVEGMFADVVNVINDIEGIVVAVDIPSGMCADGPWLEGACVHADVTVTMGLPKIGMIIHPGIEYCGELEVVDIGFPPDLTQDENLTHNLLSDEFIFNLLPERPPNSNKRTFGYVLIIAGSEGMTGAAVLSANAAIRSGAGLVYLAVPSELNARIETMCIEPVTIPLPAKHGIALNLESAEKAIELSEKVDAVAIGPGIGQDPDTRKAVLHMVSKIEKPLVIDADGLNALSGSTHILNKRPAPTILTPHPGEMGRLINTTASEVQKNRITTARTFAQKHDVVLVLKGARTLIAEPSEQVYVNPRGNTGLAKGGSGDVLTGLMVGFLAQGMSPVAAANSACYLHGLAGEVAATIASERAMNPSDLLDFIGIAFHRIGNEDLDEMDFIE